MSSLILNKYLTKNLKFKTVSFHKNGINQVFGNDTYENVITWSNINGNQEIQDLIYIENGVITISNKVKKIDIVGVIWMTQNQPNLQFDFNGSTKAFILYSQSQNRYAINNNYAIDKSKEKNTLKISPYQKGTVYGDTMWTWLNITIAYY